MTGEVTREEMAAAVRRLLDSDEAQYARIEHLCDEAARVRHDREVAAVDAALRELEAGGWREPGEKITEGLRGALHVTKLAGEIIDLLPPGVATRDLFHQIIAILAPYIAPPTTSDGGGDDR